MRDFAQTRIRFRVGAAGDYGIVLSSRGQPAGYVSSRFFRCWCGVGAICLSQLGSIRSSQRKGGALRMAELRLNEPTTILVLLGLTLPEVSDSDLEKIRAAAAPNSIIRVAPQVRDAIAMAGEVEVILGFIPESL